MSFDLFLYTSTPNLLLQDPKLFSNFTQQQTKSNPRTAGPPWQQATLTQDRCSHPGIKYKVADPVPSLQAGARPGHPHNSRCLNNRKARCQLQKWDEIPVPLRPFSTFMTKPNAFHATESQGGENKFLLPFSFPRKWDSVSFTLKGSFNLWNKQAGTCQENIVIWP